LVLLKLRTKVLPRQLQRSRELMVQNKGNGVPGDRAAAHHR
jgi:hypothetical protein